MKFTEEVKKEAREAERKAKASILLHDYLYDRHDWMDKPHRFRWVVKHVDDQQLLEDFLLCSRFIKEDMDILDKIKIACDALDKFKLRNDIMNLMHQAKTKYKVHLAEKNRTGKIINRVIMDVCDARLEEITTSKDFICS